MGFEIQVVRNNPLTGERDLDQALRTFLTQIGYLSQSYQEEVGFRLIRDCFLSYPEKAWTVDELLTYLEANRSTLYRYLNKLKGLDIIDEIVIPYEGASALNSRKTRKGYKIRYDSLSYAWNLVESHVQVSMQNYRRTVDHIDKLSKEIAKGDSRGERKKPSIATDAFIVRDARGLKEILLVRRAKEPYKGMWALPGGFVEYDEPVEKSILREVKEETGLDCKDPVLKTVRSQPGRDPRGHVISLVYSLEPDCEVEPLGGDDANEARWFSLDSLPELAFDHRDIVEELFPVT